MPSDPRVLVVRFSALGDVILTTPLVRALRTAWPDARITFVTTRAAAAVFAHSPRVDRVVALAPGAPLGTLTAQLREEAWTHRLDLHASLRALRLRTALGGRWRTWRRHRLARRMLIAFGAEWYGRLPPVAERYFETVADLGIHPDGGPPEVFTHADDRARARDVAAGEYVVMAPGASRATKRWPPSHWRELAARLRAAGLGVVAAGTAAERRLLDGDAAVPAFGEGLGVTAALLAGARCAVTNDSGLMHLATAVGTPVVALFGPTVRAFGFAPYPGPAAVLERPMACRPCSPYGSARCPLGHHRCMIDLAPATVARAVEAA
jgi:heptosyltransferase-2